MGEVCATQGWGSGFYPQTHIKSQHRSGVAENPSPGGGQRKGSGACWAQSCLTGESRPVSKDLSQTQAGGQKQWLCG